MKSEVSLEIILILFLINAINNKEFISGKEATKILSVQRYTLHKNNKKSWW